MLFSQLRDLRRARARQIALAKELLIANKLQLARWVV